ncbi:MAG: DUF2207 domain-containing protein [Clostridiales bacterium]|nr:DUF2207 domain-containing protein [Clostridiales bacterium]
MSFVFTNSTVGGDPIYYGFVGGVYGIIAVIFAFVLIFGLRARRNVKKEKITALPDGFSPLDVKRIFIGKTYPRRLTRALIAYWGECGYIKVKQLSRNTVRIIKKKDMPPHDDGAVFFDRGTYVRECDLFAILMKHIKNGKPVKLNRPLFNKYEAQVTQSYAVREDDGVYSSKHYTLKIVTIALCIVAALLAQISNVIGAPENFVGIVGVGFACIGLTVLMFVRDMPIAFKTVWCGGWLAGSTVAMCVGFSWAHDPLGLTLTSIILLYVGPLFLIRFVDYREKINLSDYSDLINYRRFLLFAPAAEVRLCDYYKVLPFLYAFRIKPFVRRKFGEQPLPDWYVNETGKKGVLL